MVSKLKLLDFYESVMSEDFVTSLVGAVEERSGVYTTVVTIWLMLFQRLNSDKSLASAVEELRNGESVRLLKKDSGSIRARARRVSSGTGSYAFARKRVPTEVVDQVCDALNESVINTHGEGAQWEGRDVYIIDGSTVRLTHHEEVLDEYPQYHNSHGKSHYPLARIGVATHAVTGVALRPAIGPYNGPDAVSELQLGEELLERLPKQSTIVGDRFYGCFRFVYKASREHEVICRMKEDRYRKAIEYISTESGEVDYLWEPSARERKKYPDLPIDASVKGRIVWYTLRKKGFRPIFLVFFTTTTLSIEKLVELYGYRWNVETDLRDIKSTLQMHMLTAKSPEMIHKELMLGVTAYNLIRHLMGIAASVLKVDPRTLSFSRVLKRVKAIGSLINAQLDPSEFYEKLAQALTDLKSLQLPKRKKTRPLEPRKKWPTGDKNFMKGSRNAERQKLLLSLQT